MPRPRTRTERHFGALDLETRIMLMGHCAGVRPCPENDAVADAVVDEAVSLGVLVVGQPIEVARHD